MPLGARIVLIAAGVGLAATNGITYSGGLEDIGAGILIVIALFAPRPSRDDSP